ncbi:hypothetical protein WMF38_57375 [Sorangium sp. So ce118]
MKTTDAHGKTLDQAVAVAQRAADLHNKPITVGRLYVSQRRWIWGERFDDVAGPLDGGAHWEPVRLVPAR